MQELKGLGVAMVTPFQPDGAIDYPALERLVKHLHTGADYLVVMGTTGEAATCTETEQIAVLDFVAEINARKLPIVFGMGGNHTAALVARMKAWGRNDVVAFLSASPYYNKPTQEGIYRHYMALAEASPLPILIYNVPGRTASNLLPSTMARLARDHKRFAGIKEAAGSIEQVMALARILPDGFLLLSGDDALMLPHMACGGHGIISVVGNAYPERFGRAVRLAANGHWSEARKLHYSLLPLVEDLFREGNPGGVKEVLRHLGICDHYLRLPLCTVTDELSKRLYRHIADLGEV
jgi:4-hydroxy-tetrahydrodipicolinate synthase